MTKQYNTASEKAAERAQSIATDTFDELLAEYANASARLHGNGNGAEYDALIAHIDAQIAKARDMGYVAGFDDAMEKQAAQPLQQEGGKDAARYRWLRDTPYLPFDFDINKRGVDLDEQIDNLQQASTAQAEPAKMECPDCGVDRLKKTCPAVDMTKCPMIGQAASATDAGQYKPEYKTITDHNGRVTGVQWTNADAAPQVGTIGHYGRVTPAILDACAGVAVAQHLAAQATPEGGQILGVYKV